MKLFLLLLLVLGIAVLASSCHNTHAEPTIPTIQPDSVVWRAKVLENGAITRVYMSTKDRTIYHSDDTVWVNMSTHMIDDAEDFTMLVVLETCGPHK